MNNTDERFFKPIVKGSSAAPPLHEPHEVRDMARKLSRCSTAEARRCLDYDMALTLQALPLGLLSLMGKEILSVASSAENEAELSAGLRFATGKEIKLVAMPSEIVRQAIFFAYQGDEKNFEIKIKTLPVEQKVRREPLIEFRKANSDASALLVTLVDYAISQSASDIHIIPAAKGCFIRLRRHGELLSHEAPIASHDLHQRIISRLKVLCSLDTTTKYLPQDGSFAVTVHADTVHLRLSIMPTIHGEKAVLRILGGEAPRELERLDFEPEILNFIDSFIDSRSGSLLVVGPTGSGKTTTMYAIMQRLAQMGLSLVSVEDPVEMQLDKVSQTGIDPKIGLDYATCLRSILRQDPNVILLGEIRDSESAKIAFQAALTGHLLISTVHARNVWEAFLRLKHLGVDPLTVAQSVSLVLAQRLLPKLCKACRVFDLKGSQLLGGEVFKGVGCSACDYTGFSGRALAVEALWLDKPSKDPFMLNMESSFEALRNGKNFISLRSSVEKLIRRGDITMEELARV